jgi:hypothetical protein
MSKFKVGDTVRRTVKSCIPSRFGELGVEYEVLEVSTDRCLLIVEGGGLADQDYFELVVPEDQQQQHDPVSKPSHYNVADVIECVSDGGPSAYYDFHSGWSTWNDFADYKAAKQWKEHAFHLGNIGKVLCRWGDKSGTTKNYDARKVVYSGLRVLLMLEDKESVRKYLESLLEDGQFKELPDE